MDCPPMDLKQWSYIGGHHDLGLVLLHLQLCEVGGGRSQMPHLHFEDVWLDFLLLERCLLVVRCLRIFLSRLFLLLSLGLRQKLNEF